MPTSLQIGIDIGGSKASALCRSTGPGTERTFHVSREGANLNAAGVDAVASLIRDIVEACRKEFGGRTPAQIVAGIAGAGRPEDGERVAMQYAIVRTHESDRLQVVSDAEIALEGAFSGGSGAIVIAGTGSGAHARDRSGILRRAGGWGPRLGDPGSGTAIGLMALRAVARTLDGGQPTRLMDAFEDHLHIRTRDDLMRSLYRERIDPASCAPAVLELAEEGDPVALNLVTEEMHQLADESILIMDENVDPRFVLVGGLCNNAWYRNHLEQAILRRRPSWRRIDPDGSPEAGALRILNRRTL